MTEFSLKRTLENWMESLVERLTAVEGRLGLPPITKSNQNLSRKLSSLQKRLSDNGYGFILKIPPKQIQKVYNFSNKVFFFFIFIYFIYQLQSTVQKKGSHILL